MFGRFRLRISLARKISLLFGAAVLSTIAVTLAFPWLQMRALTEQAMLLQAKQAASAAHQMVDLSDPDWASHQRTLESRWPLLAKELDLRAACPRLVPATFDLWRGTGFLREAAERFTEHPWQRYHWRIQDDGKLFRFALAVRGLESDPYPRALRGVIDVRLPMPWERAMWNTIITGLAGASGAVLAILVFYMATQRLVLSRVQRLRDVAEQVTAGDLDLRAAIRSRDEFQDLSDAFDNMLAHLREAQEQQERINRSLDIRLGELAQANVALYESNRLKSEFLANVSHELRTPLVSIIGFAELLRDAGTGSSSNGHRLVRYTENILSSSRGLLDLINDLLDLAKVEAGRMQVHVSEFSIEELVTDLADLVRPLADKKRQTLLLEIPPGLPRMTSDSGKIKQILYNLMNNAIKFTPPEGTITLGVDCPNPESICLTVRDTGPGIPVEQQAEIFEKFRQLDASKTREHPGTGLGLAITKELVNILGGAITLQSREGQGSTFSVTLPVTIPSQAAVRMVVNLAEAG
jgi:signal transduction histidine kinase